MRSGRGGNIPASRPVKIGFAQVNTTVGDFSGNARLLREAYAACVAAGADLVVTPELAVCGYPPLDLVFRTGFVERCERALQELAAATGSVPLIAGTLGANSDSRGRPFHNTAAVLRDGAVVQRAHKSLLPTYDVFDEGRYFEAARGPGIFEMEGRRIGLTVCEDIWVPEFLPRDYYGSSPLDALVEERLDLLVNLSASPFTGGKPAARRAMLAVVAGTLGCPVAYANLVGGNDQLVFDGRSALVGSDGRLRGEAPAFVPASMVFEVKGPPIVPAADDPVADVHEALVLGLRDYVGKCGFRDVVLGLSGGIDSAVVAALAVEAFGAERVTGVSMPGPYSSAGSIEDAVALARNLGIRCLHIPIGPAFAALKAQMAEVFAGRPEDATEENLQSRLRGLTLMALSNKFGAMLLTTGNKSELAVGYCTIYGDMAGGLAVLSDVPKTLVYQLARHINRGGERIPEASITKPPSAELRPDQTDQDTLPPYDLLDEILRRHVEEEEDADRIVAATGYDPKVVRWVVAKVDANEYKRQQAAPGLKVSGKAFGVGRRVPIAQKLPA